MSISLRSNNERVSAYLTDTAHPSIMAPLSMNNRCNNRIVVINTSDNEERYIITRENCSICKPVVQDSNVTLIVVRQIFPLR